MGFCKLKKYFDYSVGNYEEIRTLTDKCFLNGNIYVGFDEGIHIEELDENDLYTQAFI